MATKVEEIKALESLKMIVQDGESYIGELFTKERVEQMIFNIESDFPISMSLGLLEEAEVNVQANHLVEKISMLDTKLLYTKEEAKKAMHDLLHTLIRRGEFEIAYEHFTNIEVMKAKLKYLPESLTDSEKEAFLSAIQ